LEPGFVYIQEATAGLEPASWGLADLWLPEHAKTKGESPALTKAGTNPPLDNSGWQSLTYKTGPPIVELSVETASYP